MPTIVEVDAIAIQVIVVDRRNHLRPSRLDIEKSKN